MPPLSLAPYILKRPWALKMLQPLAGLYANSAGHRQLGLKHDDLIEEESENVQLALKRLSPKESYDRVFRIRRAVMCSYQHKLLPKDQWTKPEEDKPYLSPILAEIEAENKEREELDSIEVIKKH